MNARELTEHVFKVDPMFAQRLAGTGLRAIFDPASAEWNRITMGERRDTVLRLLHMGFTMCDLQEAFLSIMEAQGWSPKVEEGTFLQALGMMLDAP